MSNDNPLPVRRASGFGLKSRQSFVVSGEAWDDIDSLLVRGCVSLARPVLRVEASNLRQTNVLRDKEQPTLTLRSMKPLHVRRRKFAASVKKTDAS